MSIKCILDCSVLQRKIDKEKETEKQEPLKKSISHAPLAPSMKKNQRPVQKLPPPPPTNRPDDGRQTVCEFCKDEIRQVGDDWESKS